MAPATSGVLAGIGAFIADSQAPGQSGFWLLDRNADALTWRLALIDSAASSLDVLQAGLDRRVFVSEVLGEVPR